MINTSSQRIKTYAQNHDLCSGRTGNINNTGRIDLIDSKYSLTLSRFRITRKS